MLSPEERAMRGRIGAYVTHSRHDPRETTAKARATFLDQFERQVDPDGVLPEAERLRRAEAARKAYFTRLAYKSAKARKLKKRQATVGKTAARQEGTE